MAAIVQGTFASLAQIYGRWLSTLPLRMTHDGSVTEEPISLVDVAEIRRLAAEVVAAFATDVSGSVDGAEIHHIGATAMPFGHTKGDVDVNVRVEEAHFALVVESLSARLAIAQPENWTPTFASFSAYGYPLLLGVQVTVIGSEDDFLLALRDRMRADPDLLQRYDDAKVASAVAGAEAYWQAKDRVLKELRLS
jgi:GrpB-like predicted nucleotidyltransferase (UPF0157 family)